MDDLQCADFEAEAALLKRIVIGFPIYFESMREKSFGADKVISESRTGASHHPYDHGRTSGGLIWLADNLLEWREDVERQLAWDTHGAPVLTRRQSTGGGIRAQTRRPSAGAPQQPRSDSSCQRENKIANRKNRV